MEEYNLLLNLWRWPLLIILLDILKRVLTLFADNTYKEIRTYKWHFLSTDVLYARFSLILK